MTTTTINKLMMGDYQASGTVLKVPYLLVIYSS